MVEEYIIPYEIGRRLREKDYNGKCLMPYVEKWLLQKQILIKVISYYTMYGVFYKCVICTHQITSHVHLGYSKNYSDVTIAGLEYVLDNLI